MDYIGYRVSSREGSEPRLKLGVTVGADQRALFHFFASFSNCSCVAFAGDPEYLGAGVEVVEVECPDMAVVTA